jgi:hypothetical protein
VDLPEGTAALNMPWAVLRSTSTVGYSEKDCRTHKLQGSGCVVQWASA